MLDARRLLVLRAIAAHGSLAGAARALAFTPSAVSQQLAALEREAGLRLAERSRRGVELTDAGRALVERAEAIAAELERADVELAAVREQRRGALRVGAFPSAGLRLVPEAIVRFADSYPGVDLHLTELEPEASLPRLQRGELDLALVYECDFVPLPVDGRLEQEVLLAEPMLLADAGDGPDGQVDLASFAARPWIAPEPGSSIHAFTLRACQSAGFSPRIVSVWNDFEVVQALVVAGLAVAFVPKLAISHPGVRARPVGGAPSRRILAVWRSGTARDPLLSALRSALRDAAARA